MEGKMNKVHVLETISLGRYVERVTTEEHGRLTVTKTYSRLKEDLKITKRNWRAILKEAKEHRLEMNIVDFADVI